MFDKKRYQQYLKAECGYVAVDEHGPVGCQVGHVMQQVSGKQ